MPSPLWKSCEGNFPAAWTTLPSGTLFHNKCSAAVPPGSSVSAVPTPNLGAWVDGIQGAAGAGPVESQTSVTLSLLRNSLITGTAPGGHCVCSRMFQVPLVEAQQVPPGLQWPGASLRPGGLEGLQHAHPPPAHKPASEDPSERVSKNI